MWTAEQRRINRREGDGYPSDLKDAEWARLDSVRKVLQIGLSANS
jgi:hypothetical protein